MCQCVVACVCTCWWVERGGLVNQQTWVGTASSFLWVGWQVGKDVFSERHAQRPSENQFAMTHKFPMKYVDTVVVTLDAKKLIIVMFCCLQSSPPSSSCSTPPPPPRHVTRVKASAKVKVQVHVPGA